MGCHVITVTVLTPGVSYIITVSGYGLSCYYCHSANPSVYYVLLFQGMGCHVITVTVLMPGVSYIITVSGYGLSCYYCHSADAGCIIYYYCFRVWVIVLYLSQYNVLLLFQDMGYRVISVTVLTPVYIMYYYCFRVWVVVLLLSQC